MSEFKQYRKKQIAEMRPYVEGEDMTGITITEEDARTGSPKEGDMIARNPANHKDRWLVSGTFFNTNYVNIDTEKLEKHKDNWGMK